ncbi:MAG: hypothetical protein ABSC94_26015 [Polyangiaceae bacterium]
MTMTFRDAVLAMLVAVAIACGGCRENHPYVPYRIGVDDGAAASGASPASTSSRSAEAGVSAEEFLAQPAEAAPPDRSQWTLKELSLEAPPGQVFISAIVADFDGDGAEDAFAIVRPADGNDPGMLVFYRGTAGGSAPAVAATFAPPAGLWRDPSCGAIDRLETVGSRAVLVELGAKCPANAPTAPSRWLAVLDGTAGGRIRLAATLTDPVGAPELSIDAAVGDRDGDGRDDVALRVALDGGGPPLEPGPRLAIKLVWLDRPAGLSQDSGAVEASFATLASYASGRAHRPRDAPEIPGFVAQARALWRATCADGGAPRIVALAGTGAITCGAARALEDLGLAEVRSFVTMGDPLRAGLALDRCERPPAAQTASRVSDAQKWIAELAPIASARLLRSVAAVPLAARGRESAWGALAFEPSGKLLVRTLAGIVRVDPDLGDEAASGLPEWASNVVSPDGAMRWVDAYDPCDGLTLRAAFEVSTRGDDRDVGLPVAPPLSGRCAGSRGLARALPIAWGPSGLEAIVEDVPLLISPDRREASLLADFLGQPWSPGSPRSPDGKTYVIPTGVGFIVRGSAHARLLRSAELDGTYPTQRECAVSNDMTHVACVHAGRAWVGTWDAI